MKNFAIKYFFSIEMVIRLVILGALALALPGCGTTNPDAGKINVEVVKTEKVFIEVPETVLNKCQKPAKLTGLFAELQQGKVKEAELTRAFISSYTNEVNCWNSKEEAIKLQRELKAVTANGK
jgi:hypothetical protein